VIVDDPDHDARIEAAFEARIEAAKAEARAEDERARRILLRIGYCLVALAGLSLIVAFMVWLAR